MRLHIGWYNALVQFLGGKIDGPFDGSHLNVSIFAPAHLHLRFRCYFVRPDGQKDGRMTSLSPSCRSRQFLDGFCTTQLDSFWGCVRLCTAFSD